jgi:hypothetical protein
MLTKKMLAISIILLFLLTALNTIAAYSSDNNSDKNWFSKIIDFLKALFGASTEKIVEEPVEKEISLQNITINELEKKEKKNVTEEGEILSPSESLPPLDIFAEASVIAETLNFKIRDYHIETKARIISVLNYTPLKSPEILLKEGDIVIINFKGIGNPRMWKVMKLLKGGYCSCGEPACLSGCSLKEGKCYCPTIKGGVIRNKCSSLQD